MNPTVPVSGDGNAGATGSEVTGPVPTPAPPEECRNCRFWVAKGREYDGEYGQCRRYPPEFVKNPTQHGPRTLFPLPLADEWCGEYQPRG